MGEQISIQTSEGDLATLQSKRPKPQTLETRDDIDTANVQPRKKPSRLGLEVSTFVLRVWSLGLRAKAQKC